jgi:hypothetical protein
MKDEDAHGVEIRRMLKSCPVCQEHFDNHSYAQFAITVASTDRGTRLREFFDALKTHDWRKAIEFQEFEGLLNAAEAFALKCVSGAVVLLMVRNPFELYDANEILDYEILDATNWRGACVLDRRGQMATAIDQWRPRHITNRWTRGSIACFSPSFVDFNVSYWRSPASTQALCCLSHERTDFVS